VNILFVCSGNICRSPFAAALMRDRITTGAQTFSSNPKGLDIQIRSAGTAASSEQPMSFAMETILREKGIEPTHRSQRLQWDLIDWSDLILTMTRAQKYLLLSQIPAAAPKLATFREYIGDAVAPDIEDPFGTDLVSYRHCAAEIETACDRLLAKLQSLP
jgi:protein-tyrosine-phosphatase